MMSAFIGMKQKILGRRSANVVVGNIASLKRF